MSDGWGRNGLHARWKFLRAAALPVPRRMVHGAGRAAFGGSGVDGPTCYGCRPSCLLVRS